MISEKDCESKSHKQFNLLRFVLARGQPKRVRTRVSFTTHEGIHSLMAHSLLTPDHPVQAAQLSRLARRPLVLSK